jgi:hypothetical protein
LCSSAVYLLSTGVSYDVCIGFFLRLEAYGL